MFRWVLCLGLISLLWSTLGCSEEEGLSIQLDNTPLREPTYTIEPLEVIQAMPAKSELFLSLEHRTTKSQLLPSLLATLPQSSITSSHHLLEALGIISKNDSKIQPFFLALGFVPLKDDFTAYHVGAYLTTPTLHFDAFENALKQRANQEHLSFSKHDKWLLIKDSQREGFLAFTPISNHRMQGQALSTTSSKTTLLPAHSTDDTIWFQEALKLQSKEASTELLLNVRNLKRYADFLIPKDFNFRNRFLTGESLTLQLTEIKDMISCQIHLTTKDEQAGLSLYNDLVLLRTWLMQYVSQKTHLKHLAELISKIYLYHDKEVVSLQFKIPINTFNLLLEDYLKKL